MKAFLKIEQNTEKEIFNEQKLIMKDLLISQTEPIEKLGFVNYSYSAKKGEKICDDYLTITYLKDIEYKEKLIQKDNINSYEVFLSVYNFGNEINNLIIEKDFNNVEYFDYKKIMANLLTRNKFQHLNEIAQSILCLIEKYGFVSTTKDNFDSRCVLIELTEISYMIYEAFLLKNIYRNEKKRYSKIFEHFNKNINNDIIINYINKIITWIDNNYTNHCNFISQYDKENEKWNTHLIFNNFILFAIYELKIQLSEDNNDETIGICKNIACNNSFKRNGYRQQYCLSYECNLLRYKQRKEKSRGKKKKSHNI